jgi:hypothetical protein
VLSTGCPKQLCRNLTIARSSATAEEASANRQRWEESGRSGSVDSWCVANVCWLNIEFQPRAWMADVGANAQRDFGFYRFPQREVVAYRKWTLNWDEITPNIIVGSCPRSTQDVVRTLQQATD